MGKLIDLAIGITLPFMFRIPLRIPHSHVESKKMGEGSHSLQLAVALTAGLGLGLVIGALLFKRRRLPLVSLREAHGEQEVQNFVSLSVAYPEIYKNNMRIP